MSQPDPTADFVIPTDQLADPLAWARCFLPHYFTDEPAAFHAELMNDLADRSCRFVARVAPRGHAKSTCAALAFPLWSICESARRTHDADQFPRNIVIITHESSLARQFVRDIRIELETNERIRAFYGDLCSYAPSADAIESASPAGEPAPVTPRRANRAGQTPAPRSRSKRANANSAANRRSARSTKPRATRQPSSQSARARSANRRQTRLADLAGPLHANPQRRARRKWTESMFITTTGVAVQARSTGGSFRGARVGPNRPDLVICDDLEKDDHVATPEGRARLERWMRRVVLPALAPNGRIFLLGSIIHHDSLLANLRDRDRWPGWHYAVHRAIEFVPLVDPANQPHEETSSPMNGSTNGAAHAVESTNGDARADIDPPVELTSQFPAGDAGEDVFLATPPPKFRRVALWPARWPLERLEAERRRIGAIAFEQEYLANPIDDSIRVFRPEWLRPYDPTELEHRDLLQLVAFDPATGVRTGDYCALWVGSLDRTSGVIFTRELRLERLSIVDQIRLILDACQRWRPVRVGIETTAYQVVLRQILEEHSRRSGLYLPIVSIAALDNKRARIEATAPFFENGVFRLPPGLSPEIESQFLHFPKARHDDAPDVCAMGIQLARSLRAAGPGPVGMLSQMSRFPRHGGW